MVSQFISPDNVGLLGDLEYEFPEGIHAIGRLDNLSEGLLILTTNKKITKLLFESKTPHKRTYLVQVKNVVSPETVELLRNGVVFKIKGNVDWVSTPCEVELVEKPADLFTGAFPDSESRPHSWLLITLTEGKFHQVRKMVMAVRHRCLRLIRVSIEDLELGNLKPGQVRELEENDFFDRLKLVKGLSQLAGSKN